MGSPSRTQRRISVAEIFTIGHFGLIFQTFPTIREALAAASHEAAAAYDGG